MPLQTKSFTDFVRLIQGKFMKELPAIDPTIKASLAGASTVSTAAGSVSLQEGTKDAVRQSFWQTQDGDFLELTGNLNDTDRFAPQEAAGFGAATGVLGTVILADTPVTFNGNTYLVIQDSAIQEFSGGIALSLSAGIVTAVTTAEHSLSTGLSVVITGSAQTDYNGTFDIVVLDKNIFTYELIAGALTTDNGTYTTEYALLNMESNGTGAVQNIASGGIMTISFTNVDPDVFVGTNGIDGGADEENEEDYRERVGESYSLTPGIATPPSLVASAKSIPGNTRVFVVRPDGTIGGTQGQAGYKPDLGETVIYILRDDDQSILPSSTVLTATKDQILSDGLWPTFTPDDQLYVLAPILQTQDFVFTSITPNTITMQNAIRDQLKSFFEDNSEIEGTISLVKTLNPFLQKVTDPSTGALLSDFTFTTPNTDIVAASGEIFTVGTVSFP